VSALPIAKAGAPLMPMGGAGPVAQLRAQAHCVRIIGRSERELGEKTAALIADTLLDAANLVERLQGQIAQLELERDK
jgi:hypothetical protein